MRRISKLLSGAACLMFAAAVAQAAPALTPHGTTTSTTQNSSGQPLPKGKMHCTPQSAKIAKAAPAGKGGPCANLIFDRWGNLIY